MKAIKRRAALLLAVLLLFSTLSVQASEPMRVSGTRPALNFVGYTAFCTATVQTSNSSDSVSVTMKLWQGSTCLVTWTGSGTGTTKLTRSKTVTKSGTYKLTVDATINGVKQATVSTTASC